MAVLASSVAVLIAVVAAGPFSPRLPATTTPAAPAVAQNHQAPPPPAVIRLSETRRAASLQAAFNRIGFDLDAVAAGYISVPRVVLAALPPDLDRMEDAEARKSLFLRSLLPIILQVNDRIGEDRARLLALRRKVRAEIQLSGAEVQWLLDLADRYDQADADLDALVKKVDVLPPSLALAQAIEESGWGTSRLARKNNALFGQFGEDEAGNYDYVTFANLKETVEAYAHNLNTHLAYREFRQARAQMRNSPHGLDVRQLAGNLHRYSERGTDYVDSLRAIIAANRLEALDGARLNQHMPTAIVASNER